MHPEIRPEVVKYFSARCKKYPAVELKQQDGEWVFKLWLDEDNRRNYELDSTELSEIGQELIGSLISAAYACVSEYAGKEQNNLLALGLQWRMWAGKGKA
jgi:hypothetical protein